MAVGTPVIASQVSSLPEVVGDAGFLVNPYDVNSLSFAMEQILSDESLRQKLIQKATQRVEQFSWKSAAEQTLAAFDHVQVKTI
jgi:glycosyltransferase involved in cell wall biosynthesis